jgi:NAD(P)H-nitrite reductase large subunit
VSARKILIIGNGVAGVTAARTLRRLGSKDEITLISAETDHFFSRTALMYIYMGHMQYENTKPYEDGFWDEHRIGRLRARVMRVDTGAKQLHLDSGATAPYDALVIASGSKSNKFG